MTENEKLAYLAGILDGEGYIAIAQRKTTARLIVRIGMVSPKAVEFLHQNFGGSRHYQATKTNRIDNRLLWTSARAKELLEKCLPYLLVKRELAELGIKFESLRQADPRTLGRGGHHTDIYMAAIPEFAAKSKELIRKQYEAVNV